MGDYSNATIDILTNSNRTIDTSNIMSSLWKSFPAIWLLNYFKNKKKWPPSREKNGWKSAFLHGIDKKEIRKDSMNIHIAKISLLLCIIDRVCHSYHILCWNSNIVVVWCLYHEYKFICFWSLWGLNHCIMIFWMNSTTIYYFHKYLQMLW